MDGAQEVVLRAAVSHGPRRVQRCSVGFPAGQVAKVISHRQERAGASLGAMAVFFSCWPRVNKSWAPCGRALVGSISLVAFSTGSWGRSVGETGMTVR